MSESGGSNPGSSPGEHEFGANEAKAYVAPQTVKMKSKPAETPAEKVQINAGASAPGTAAAQPIPPEVYAHQAATPFQQPSNPPQPPAAVSSAPGPSSPNANAGLPFQQSAPARPVAPPGPVPPGPVQPGPVAPAAAPVAPAPAAAPAPPAPSGPTPKHPPSQLATPGVLSGASGAPPMVRASLGAGSAPAPAVAAAPAEAVVSAPPAAPADGGGYPPAPGGYPAAPQGSPAGAAAAPQADEPSAGPTGTPDAPATSDGATEASAPGADHPLAATNSPWSHTQSVAQDLLPSANMLAQPEPDSAPAPPPPPVTPQRSSRGMVVGLAIAAVALLAAIIGFVVTEQDKSDGDPAEIKDGTEQKEWEYDEPAPSAETPKPKPAPKPVFRPPPKPQPKKEDIYDGLE